MVHRRERDRRVGVDRRADDDDVGAAGGEEAGRVGVVRDAVGEESVDRRPGVGDADEPDATVAVCGEDGAEMRGAVAADADEPGQKAAETVAARWREAGREAVIIAPPAGDWADARKEQAA